MIKDKKILVAGLNADDTDFAVAASEYINAENIRWGTTDAGSVGHIEPIGSNVGITFTLPAGTNTCIGRCTDEARSRIIYFNYNSNGNHGIYAYDEVSETTYEVLLEADVTQQTPAVTGSGLNFSKDYLIHSAAVIGDMLYWTDNYNEPRRINTEAGIKYYDGTYVTDVEPYTSPIEQSVITIIRKPPARPPVAVKVVLGGIVGNVEGFAGQFAYRYIYRDNEESVLSPISALVNYNAQSGTVYDAVTITADLDEYIEQDVQIVDFCVRYGNSGQFYIIRSWDKDNDDDLADITAHNAGTTALTYNFLNDKTGNPLGDYYSITKQSDAVPRLSKTLETAENRLFLANNLVGYNSPTKSSLDYTLTQNAVNSAPWQNPVFKSGGIYQLAIRFRDEYKRPIGNIYTNKNLKVQIPDRDWDLTPYTTYIASTLTNNDYTEIPEEAHYYDLLMTKNLKTRFFVQGAAQYLMYAIKDPTTGVITFTGTYSATAYGLAVNTSPLNGFGMGYTYQEGDIMRVFSTLFTDFTAKVIDQQGVYVIVQLQDLTALANPLVGPYASTGFEIYTPYSISESEPFYTYGHADVINNPGGAFRTYNTLGFAFQGDTYIRTSPASSPAGNFEYMSNNDKYWRTWYSDWGEANYDFKTEEKRKDTAIAYSNVLLQGSSINGLSTFDAADQQLLSEEVGAISKLVRTSKVQGDQGVVMLAICEGETASIYIGEVQLVGSTANAFLASAPGVLGTINILKGSYGTVNPESVIEHRGNVFWFDLRNGMFIQYSLNGLDVISDFKMRRFAKLFSERFKSLTSAEIEAYGNRPFVFGIVDKYHNEAMWSIPKIDTEPPKGYLQDYTSAPDVFTEPYPYDIYDCFAKTIVYKIGAQKWIGAYSHYAEMFATIGSNLYSFSLGKAWKHNDTASSNNFYGVQYDSKIMLLCNADPMEIKTFISLAIQANIMPSFVHMRSEYPYIQSTDLDQDDFEIKEGVHCSPVYRDRLSPNSTGEYEEIMYTGDKMRNTALRVMLQWTNADLDSDFTDFKFITFGYNKSLGQG